MIYKIFRTPEWAELQANGMTHGVPIDLADGFIHFSAKDQLLETAAKHFAGVNDLWLAAIDPDPLGDDLKWEPSRGGALFPHLYRALKTSDVQWCCELPLGQKGHIFPDGLL